MNTNTDFILGSICSLGAIFLGFSIYTILKMNKRIKELETIPKEIDNLYQKKDSDFSALHNSIDSLNAQLRSYIDSRIDRLISNVSVEIAELRKDDERLRQFIEDVATDHSDRLATLETYKKIDDDKIEQINS